MAVFSSDGEDEERLKTYILIHQKRFHSGPKNYRDTAILRRSYTKSYNPLLSTDDLKRADRFRRVQHPEAELLCDTTVTGGCFEALGKPLSGGQHAGLAAKSVSRALQLHAMALPLWTSR